MKEQLTPEQIDAMSVGPEMGALIEIEIYQSISLTDSEIEIFKATSAMFSNQKFKEEEEKKARAWRLSTVFRRVNQLAHTGRVPLLVEWCAFVAAVVAVYQSLDIPAEIIEKEIERL